MNNFRNKISVFGFAGVLYLVGRFLGEPQIFGFCKMRPYQSDLCLADTAVNIGWPLIAAGEIFAIVGIILLLANERGVRAWWRVSRWFVPTATLLAIVLPITFSLPVTGYISRESVVWLLGYLYILLTLAIVLWSWWKGRNRAV